MHRPRTLIDRFMAIAAWETAGGRGVLGQIAGDATSPQSETLPERGLEEPCCEHRWSLQTPGRGVRS